MGDESRYAPEDIEAGNAELDEHFHIEEKPVPYPQTDKHRGESDEIEAPNAPLPITGTVSGETAKDYNQLTCMWQYQYGVTEDSTQWFTRGQVTNIQEIGRISDNRNWYVPEDVQLGQTLTSEQIETLSQSYDDNGWDLTTEERERWETEVFLEDVSQEEREPESIVDRILRWILR